MSRLRSRTRTLLGMLTSIRRRTQRPRRRIPPDQPYTCIEHCKLHVCFKVARVSHIDFQMHACVTITHVFHIILLLML